MHPFPSAMMQGGGTGYRLFAWGANTYGQLGDGTTVAKSSPIQVGSQKWARVSAGNNHVVALSPYGTLWAWGRNQYGQLGDGTVVSKSAPVQIGTGKTWSNVFAGFYITFATKSDGTLWAWGYSQFGGLGNGTTAPNVSSPVQIGALTDWAGVKMAFGRGGVAAVKSNGTLWAWGNNQQGQVGDGTIASKSSPVQIGALSDWALVSGGYLFRHAVRSNGTLWAWGSNNNGVLGLGDTVDRSSPTQVGLLTNWTGRLNNNSGAGNFGTFSIVKSNGQLWGVGTNSYGRIGDSTVINKSSPVQIGALTNWLPTSAYAIARGYGQCVAVKGDGSLWAWGNGFSGALGLGNTNNYSSPVQVGSGTNWVAVAAGNNFTMALAR